MGGMPPFFGQHYRKDMGLSKKYSKHSKQITSIVNLAALDCYATIEGTRSPYQKTYQDKLDVNCLVDDIFQKDKPFNLDKIFDEQTHVYQ